MGFVDLYRFIELAFARLVLQRGGSVNLDELKNRYKSILASVLDSAGTLDMVKFTALNDVEKQNLTNALDDFLKALNVALVDGPEDPKHIMHRDFTSTFAICALLTFAAVLTLSDLTVIYYLWPHATAGYTVEDLRGTRPSEPQASPSPSPEKKGSSSVLSVVPNAAAQANPATNPNPGASNPGNAVPGAGAPASSNNPTATTLRITPETVLLYPGESRQFKAEIGGEGQQSRELEWSDPSTGVLSASGSYVAPPQIANSQNVRIEASIVGTNPLIKAHATVMLSPPPGPKEEIVLLMVMFLGALGGLIHLISSVSLFVGNRQFLRSWAPYYLLMPLEGAALAVACYLLLRVGVLSPANTSGNATSSLNLIGIYGFAILTGIFSKQALQMLADVFSTVFKKVQGKDAPKEPQPQQAK
jgi:hypothetical protein